MEKRLRYWEIEFTGWCANHSIKVVADSEANAINRFKELVGEHIAMHKIIDVKKGDLFDRKRKRKCQKVN